MKHTIECIAKTAHEVNRAYCLGLGDTSQLPWEEAPEWQRDSAKQGVVFILGGDRSPEDTHRAWSDAKIAEGWKFGPVKDADKKEHPCLVPYDELPLEQRMKDYLFRGVVESFR